MWPDIEWPHRGIPKELIWLQTSGSSEMRWFHHSKTLESGKVRPSGSKMRDIPQNQRSNFVKIESPKNRWSGWPGSVEKSTLGMFGERLSSCSRICAGPKVHACRSFPGTAGRSHSRRRWVFVDPSLWGSIEC
jgi:hypothetical protein